MSAHDMGQPEACELRAPHLDDVDALAAVHVQAWRETYAEQLPEEFYGERALDMRRRLWRRLVEEPAPGSHTVAAVRFGEIVGFASAGRPISPEQPAPADRELFMIYLLAAHHGCGAGQAMLDGVVGDAPAFLWVAADNPRAHAFYVRNGFSFDGIEKPDDRVPTFVERRMVRTSNGAPGTGL